MNNPRQGFVRAKALRVIAVFAGLQCLALAASADPMKSTVKSEWVYIAYPTGGLAYCYSSDMDAANAVIAPAAGDFCNWTTTWPGGDDPNGDLAPHCKPPSVGGYTASHYEGRQFRWKWDWQSCAGSVQNASVDREFWYYCDDPAYELYFPPSQTRPTCKLKPNAVDPAKQPPCFPKCTTGNPIDVVTGNKYQREPDYQGSGRFPLQFARHLNAGQWSNSYSMKITGGQSIDTPTYKFWAYRAVRADGRSIPYWAEQSLPLQYDPDTTERLNVLTSAGVITGFELKTDSDQTEIYDAAGKLTSITTRSGLTQSLAYDGSGRLATVTDPDGRQLVFGYNGSGQLATLTLPGNTFIQYGYDTNGRLETVTYPDTRIRTYLYNESAYTSGANLPNALTGILDESGVRYGTYQYDATGKAIQTEHAGGADRVTVAYNPNGTRTITNALGDARTFNWVARFGVGKPSGVSGAQCAGCNYNASEVWSTTNGTLTQSTDFNGRVTSYGYTSDGRNLENSRTEALGTPIARTTTTTWHAAFRLPTSLAEANRTTSFTHDANGNVLTRTVTDTAATPNVSRTWTYTYNGAGQVLTEDGPRTDVSDVTTYAYYTCATGSECGQVNTITNALGHVTTYNSYNAHGQPTQVTDPNGLVVTLAYDARQRLTDRCVGGTLPSCTGGELTHLEYWPTGLLKRVTNPDVSFVEYTYDNAHRLIEIKDGANNKIVYTLDAMGNRTAENTHDPTLALKRTHSRVFNTLNQLWKDVNAAGTANVTTTFGYDTNGNQTTTNAPLSRNSTNAYDELNRLNQITDPASGATLFGYDANDNLTSVTDPRTLVTSYTYTGFGDLKTQTSPDTGLTTNTYDSGGNLATSTDSRGAVTTYGYDAMNRVTSTSYMLSGVTDQTISYVYDTGTNQKGLLKTASDANHTLAWTYDSQGRVIGKGQTVGTVTKSVGYGYNTVGQLASIVLPSGRTIQYGYDTLGQVTSVTLLGTPNVTILNNVTYDPFGPVTGWTWGNGTASVSRAFDTDGKLTGVTNTPSALGNRSFGYDDAFRITSTTDSASGGPAWTLGYDNLDRLNSATRTGLTIGYTYDANGNRLSQTGTSASTYSVSSTSNRLTSTTGALARTYTYNNAGSALTSGATTHTYYNNGRMRTGRLGAASNTTYIYNALGQRVRKSGGGATHTLYVYDEAGHLIGEYNSSGALVQETVWLGGIPVATLRPSGSNVTVFYVHTDQLNTPRKVTNTSNQLRWRWDPNPFGEGTPNENPASLGTFRYNLRFPGQLFDSETNLNYNYFRDYDPATGRYTKSDPIGLSGGINTYAYVRGNPLSYGDPTGLAPPGRTQPGTGFPALGIPGPFDESWNQARDGAVNDIESALGALGNAIGNIGRPKDMTREEESLYDRYCKGDGDRCAALKALTMSEIVQARTKMNRMLTDPNGLYGTEGWFNHQDDLRGRVGKIFNLISLGQKMGCDMTEEIIATTGLMVPNAPL